MRTVDFFTPIQEKLDLVEARMRRQADGHHPDLDAALDLLLSSGGKRVRPNVVLLVGGMLGADEEYLITLASAVELLHTATLVHDDLIDGSLLRRGMPTLNAKWSPAATILTGDFIFARAAKLAAETQSIDIMHLFAKTLSVIVNGEISQMFDGKGQANRQDYYERIYAKTASMFELAATAPVYLSDADDEDLAALQRFGYEIGMAFQMVDDVFDFSSEAEEIGKPVANDLRHGLITLPALYYMENNPEDSDILSASNGGILGREKMDRLVEAIRQSDAVEQSMDEASRYVQRGIEALSAFPISPEREALEGLARYIIRRII